MKGGNLPEWAFLENVLETMREICFLKNPSQDIERAQEGGATNLGSWAPY